LIRTYLLEQVRLVKQQKGERSFHVFYQLLAGSSPEERAARRLTRAEEFRLTNQGDTYTLRSVDDAQEFAALKRAWDVLDFSPAEQSALLDVMAALLHLSELAFDPAGAGGDGSVVSAAAAVRDHMEAFSELSRLPLEQVERALTVRTITTRTESYEINLTAAQAADARDAIAKSIYSKVFLHIVARVNESIRVDDSSKIRSAINCLDIFGFECFQTNSFEQLCINYWYGCTFVSAASILTTSPVIKSICYC
jgi:myosin heavy subunit